MEQKIIIIFDEKTMDTTIDIDEDLLNEALKFVHVKNKNELFTIALKVLINKFRHNNIRDLKGKIKFADGYSYKDMRR